MVYYTPEFEQEFDNPQAVIDSHIAQTNDAFIQSGIGHVQLQLLCTERIDVMDSKTDDAGARLDAFSNAKGGDVGYILNSADIAMLMTKYGVRIFFTAIIVILHSVPVKWSTSGPAKLTI